MKSTLDYLNGHLCILNESELGTSSPGGPPGNISEWYAVREAAEAEVATLVGRPVTRVESDEGLYVDEDGNVFQLLNKGETKPIQVEHLPGKEKTELEVLLEASLKGGQANGKNNGAKRLLKKNRSSSRKQQALRDGTAKPGGARPRPLLPSRRAPRLSMSPFLETRCD